MHLLFRLSKGKGILVILYFIVSSFVSAMLVGFLDRNVGGVFSKIDFYTTMGISFLITSVWAYLTKDDYYKDKDGNKKKMDSVNSFVFIRMGIWVIIFFCLALMFLGNSLVHYFKPAAF